MSDLITRAKNIKLQYSKSHNLTPSVFNDLVDLIVSNLVVSNNQETAISIRNKLQTLFGDDRLDVSAIKNIVSGGASTAETAQSIRNKLQTLVAFERLDSSAIKNLVAANITYATSSTSVVSVQFIIDKIIQTTSILIIDGDGSKFLNDQGEYVYVNWLDIEDAPTKTSDFENDGSDGTDTYVEYEELYEILDDNTFTSNFGDDANNEFVFTHTLNTQDLVIQIYENSTGQLVRMQIVISSESTITVSCNTPPTIDQYKIVAKK